jgi:molybdate transport system substrate-binding protein
MLLSREGRITPLLFGDETKADAAPPTVRDQKDRTTGNIKARHEIFWRLMRTDDYPVTRAVPVDPATFFPLRSESMELRNNASRAGLIATTRRMLSSLVSGLATGAVVLTQSVFGGADAATAAPDTPAPPVVFAAASMKTALDAVVAAWKAQTGKTVSIVYASSATLAKQIEQGAPADMFISADLKWMDYLEKANLVRVGTRRNLFGNTLVLIEPSDTDVKLEIAKGFDLAGAAGDGKIAVCMIDSCPAGIYAKEALESLGVLAGVEPKLAQADNVRAALNLVSRGEAKFGIVYATDARADRKVKVVGTFPASTHDPIVYPVALVAASANLDAAFFFAYLTSQAATRFFLEQGFEVLSK